jgi:lysophospholipase L1-like esterase
MDAAVSRVLILGDSTGVGIGAASPSGALAGLIAQHHPGVEILNLSQSGARIADVRLQVEDPRIGQRRFDLVLLHVGGNDVMRAWRIGELARCADDMLRRVRVLAPCTLWLGPGDVGAAPLFVPPFNWWMSRRTRQAGAMFERSARRAGVRFVGFHSPSHTRVFTSDRRHFYADDAIHPSDATYAYCWQHLRHMPELRSALEIGNAAWAQ